MTSSKQLKVRPHSPHPPIAHRSQVHDRYVKMQKEQERKRFDIYRNDIKEIKQRTEDKEKENIQKSLRDYYNYQNDRRAFSSYSFTRTKKSFDMSESSPGDLSNRKRFLYQSKL